MKRQKNAVVIFIVTILTLSVSAFASDKTSTIQPELQMASTDQPAETGHAKATLHEAGGTAAIHDTSGSDHGQGHPIGGQVAHQPVFQPQLPSREVAQLAGRHDGVQLLDRGVFLQFGDLLVQRVTRAGRGGYLVDRQFW